MNKIFIIIIIILLIGIFFLSNKKIEYHINPNTTNKIKNKKIYKKINYNDDLDDTKTADVYVEFDNSSRYQNLRY